MEVSQSRVRRAYYFSWVDQEILGEHSLALSCDEETWLYTVDSSSKGQYSHFELGSPFHNQQTSTIGGSVDSRTYTRRKHCALRPSLESVVESPLSNRSSLGLLSASKLLKDPFPCTPTPHSENQEKTSSSSIGSEKKPLAHRVFKLDSPFMNSAVLGGSQFPATNYTFEKARLNSDASELSVPFSLENCSYFESPMSDSLICLPSDGCEPHRKDGKMTDSLVNFLEPVNCRPPSGFRDNEMTDSVVNVHEVDGLPNCEMTNSVKDYLENIRSNSPGLLIRSTASSETENIPPYNCSKGDNYQKVGDSINVIGDGKDKDIKNLNSTYDLENNGMYRLEKNGDTTYDLNDENGEIKNITFTNTVNITRKNKDKSSFKDEVNITRTLNIGRSYEKDISTVKELSEKSLKTRALNNKDLNLNETSRMNRQIPSRNSPFNTTFTKMSLQGNMINSTVTKPHPQCSEFARSTEMLNGGLEDDRTSSASDSSFSSCSTKPRSVDELRTIAQQQETSLALHTSTPTGSNFSTSNLVVCSADMDIELSPIRRLSTGGRHSESRSANCSPVRSHQQPRSFQHPISRLKQPSMEVTRQMLPASSMSNISRPKLSGLRMPKPVTRFTAPQRVESRPSTVPILAPTSQGIPRPQVSRLPTPRFRGSSCIAGPRRGGL